ncbi:hypothetical protein SVAN01_11094 [Stagonosporopsis vannaccii]|nr:hypothetical protein SVAN01_11094 [Stagonosporopsis vannaccii]
MGLSESATLLGVVGLLTVLGGYLANALRFKIDSQEPQVIYPKIPLIGHIIGSLMDGTTYFKKLHEKHGHAIFTLPMLTGRTYVVASPELCSAVQKASSTLDLDPIIGELGPRLMLLGPKTAALLRRPGRNNFHKQSHTILTSQNFSAGIERQLVYLGQSINNVQNGSELNLFHFLRREISAASMKVLFGPRNPYAKHPELLDSFWDWESGHITLLTGFFPSLTARKAYRGFMACAKGFAEYIEDGGFDDAADFIQDRNRLNLQHGVTDPLERGKLDTGLGLGVNVNASITIFWLLNTVFSRPDLLSRLRDEIRENALISPGVLSSERLQQACPQLNSVWREVMRLYALMITVRYVEEDTKIADTYLLRKGSIVQLAGGALHFDKNLWGPDADEFNPDRFLYSKDGSKAGVDGSVLPGRANSVHPATFRSFGGGASLCPGRYFAQAEIIGLSALLLLGYDMTPINGTSWNPPADRKRTPISVMKPLKDVDVKLQRRKEFQDIEWELKLR